MAAFRQVTGGSLGGTNIPSCFTYRPKTTSAILTCVKPIAVFRHAIANQCFRGLVAASSGAVGAGALPASRSHGAFGLTSCPRQRARLAGWPRPVIRRRNATSTGWGNLICHAGENSVALDNRDRRSAGSKPGRGRYPARALPRSPPPAWRPSQRLPPVPSSRWETVATFWFRASKRCSSGASDPGSLRVSPAPDSGSGAHSGSSPLPPRRHHPMQAARSPASA